MLQNVNEVNRQRTRIAAASSVHDSTRQSGLITLLFITNSGFMNKWTYDSKIGTCVEYIYGGCFGTENLFNTKEECDTKCTKVHPVSFHFNYSGEFEIQYGSKYQTSLVFEWSKRGWLPNGLVFKCHLNTEQPNQLNTT